MAGVDGCFHLAAIASVQRSNEDWVPVHRVNLTGSIAVFDAARGAKDGNAVPVVYASSAAVYGDNPNVPLTEDAATRPLTAYGADKLGSEQHARVAGNVHGVATTGFRFFNVYGPRQDPLSPYSGVISIFANRLAAGEPVTIFGDGEQTRDFVYVADVVRHLIAGMQNAALAAPVYNVCTGRKTDVLTLATTIAELLQTKAEIHFGAPRPGDIKHSLGSPVAATQNLSVAAEVGLTEGLGHLLNSVRQA
jgi:UDP-glucose 4-epimerase